MTPPLLTRTTRPGTDTDVLRQWALEQPLGFRVWGEGFVEKSNKALTPGPCPETKFE